MQEENKKGQLFFKINTVIVIGIDFFSIFVS